jgi:hypothetical protein
MRIVTRRRPARARLGALGAAILVALLAPAAVARADAGAITIVSADGDRTTATFSVTKTTCATPYYCGWFAYATLHPASQACATTSPVWVDAVHYDLTPISGSADFYSFASEGPHRLCLYVYQNSADVLLAEVVYGQNVPPPPPPPTPPPVSPPTAPAPPAVDTTPIPRSIGHGDPSTETLAIFPADAPSDVDPARFTALVRGVAQRWDIYTGGVSAREFVFDRPDGRNGIGFDWLESGSLGTTVTYSVRLYRKRTLCRRRGGKRVCHTARRYLSSEIVERDTAFAPDVPWQQGPGYPDLEQYDLETVMIHELGHWAGNKHTRLCTASPMVPALDTGEWWRNPADFRFIGCGVATAAAHHSTGRLEHRTRSVDAVLPRRVPVRAARAHARTVWTHRAIVAAR